MARMKPPVRVALAAALLLACQKPVVYGAYTGTAGGTYVQRRVSERNDPNLETARFEGADNATVTAEPGGVKIEWADCELHAPLTGSAAVFTSGQSCTMSVPGHGMFLISDIHGRAIFSGNRVEITLSGTGPDIGGGASTCERTFEGTTP